MSDEPQIESLTYDLSSNYIQFETLQQQYNTALNSYKQSYQTLISAYQNNETSSIGNYIANVQNWSAVLNDLNNKIISLLENQGPNLNQEVQQRQLQNNNLNSTLQNLLAEHTKVNKHIDDYQSSYIGKSETEINVHQKYMKYIFYVIICIIVFFIFIKVVFVSKSTQSGGGSRTTKLGDILYLLALMVIFLGFGIFFKENAGFIIIILLLVFYIFIKMKFIPNFLRI
jgi:hypothetical protein